MSEGYETFEMTWQERQITVSHQANWLGSGQWHVELRCAERLPLTETFYRSIFVPQAEFADDADIAAFVLRVLDEAAQSKAWQDYLEDSRQLKLF